MATVHALIRGRRHVIDLDDVRDRAGSGGEAVVKIIDGEAVKIRHQYDPDLAGKLRDTPKGVHPNVIMPQEPVLDARDPSRVIGFTMKLVEGISRTPTREPETFPISMFGDADFQSQHNLTWQKLVRVLLNLHDRVGDVHKSGIILGDFNEKNVLVNVRTLEVFLVDMDAAWWGKWKTFTFTSEFTDARLLRAGAEQGDPPVLIPNARYTQETDWYAYTAIVCKVLIGGTPYRDGVHQPKDGSEIQRLNQRVLSRLTYFDKSIRLASDAYRHPSALPAGLGLFLRDVFVEDRRETPFPRAFLETYVQITCACGAKHGRRKCPKCGRPGITVATTPYFKPGEQPASNRHSDGNEAGIIIATTPFGENIRYVHHHNGVYRREDGSIVLRRSFSPGITALVAGERTVLIAGQKFAIVGKRRAPKKYYATQRTLGRITVAANSRHVYWMNGNHLVREDSLRGITSIGPCPANMTSVWAGEQFGVALVHEQSGTSIRTFTDTGFTGSSPLPILPGTIVDAVCVVGNDLAWLKVTTQWARKRTTTVYVINTAAQLLATAEADGSTTYLGRLASSALAVSNMLFVPVEGVGLVRFKIEHGAVYMDGALNHTTTFQDTVGFCMNSTGLIHVSRGNVKHILTNA